MEKETFGDFLEGAQKFYEGVRARGADVYFVEQGYPFMKSVELAVVLPQRERERDSEGNLLLSDSDFESFPESFPGQYLDKLRAGKIKFGDTPSRGSYTERGIRTLSEKGWASIFYSEPDLC